MKATSGAIETVLEQFWINDVEDHGRLRPGLHELICVLSHCFDDRPNSSGPSLRPLDDGTYISDANLKLIKVARELDNPDEFHLRLMEELPRRS